MQYLSSNLAKILILYEEDDTKLNSNIQPLKLT